MRYLLIYIYHSFFLLVILLTIYSCTINEDSQNKNIDIQFIEELVIGDEVEPLLINPFEVKTDASGRIYIADRESNSVKVFNASGDFLNSIGSMGRGPAEIGWLSTFELNSENEVILFDNGNQRVSRFASDGELIEIHLLDPKHFVWPHQLRELSKDGYALVRKPRDADQGFSEDAQQRNSFIHVYDRDFRNSSTSFANINDVLDSDEPFARKFINQISSGNIWPLENGHVLFVPAIYDGRIFQFGEVNGKWEMISTFAGKVMVDNPVEVNLREEGTISITINQGTFVGRISSESLGVFVLNDGRIVHFSNQYVDNVRIVMVEVFDDQGRITGVGELSGFDFSNSVFELVKYIWLDTQNRFYFIDNADIPKVRIGRLNGL